MSQIVTAKNELTPEELCKSSRAAPFIDFVQKVFALGFSDKPDYDTLRNILVQILHDRKMQADGEYDWTPTQQHSHYHQQLHQLHPSLSQ